MNNFNHDAPGDEFRVIVHSRPYRPSGSMREPIRILLADDHRIIVDGLVGLLSEASDMECVHTCSNGQEALEALAHLRVDVVLMDIEMPVLDGLAAMERIARMDPRPRTIVLSMHDEPSVVQRVMELGADGYLVKDCGREELLFAIRNVHAGKRHFASTAVEGLLKQRKVTTDDRDLLKDLSEREVEVLAALAEGLGSKEIGDRLFLGADVSWTPTNDLASLDADGFLYIHGRVDDTIIRGGFKVDTAAVAAVLMQHPAVREASVVGLPDERLGQVPVAAVELREGAAATTEDDLRAHAARLLSPYQIPVRFKLVVALPRTVSMKVSRPGVLSLFA